MSGTDEDRVDALLARLKGVPDERRTARFRAVAALAWPDGRVMTAEGKVEGRLAHAPRGQGGFGYDPLFIPDGYTKTFAEMDEEQKNSISHRAVAFQKAKHYLEKLSAGGIGK